MLSIAHTSVLRCLLRPSGLFGKHLVRNIALLGVSTLAVLKALDLFMYGGRFIGMSRVAPCRRSRGSAFAHMDGYVQPVVDLREFG